MNTHIYYSIQKNIFQYYSTLLSFILLLQRDYPEFLEINSLAFLNTTVLITRV